MKRLTSSQIPTAVAARDEFKASSMIAGWAVYSSIDMGRLPVEWATALRSEIEAADYGTYIVWSYGTPIAWYTPNVGWTLPTVRYSKTTTIHQRITEKGLCGEVRVAL